MYSNCMLPLFRIDTISSLTMIVLLADVALDLLEKHPELAVACDANEETALLALARMPIASQIQQGFWKQCVNLC